MQHSLFIETAWRCWLMLGWWTTASLWCFFFQDSFATNCFLVFICADDYSCLNVSYTKEMTHRTVRWAMQVHFSVILHLSPWLLIHCMGRWCLYPDTQIFGKLECVLSLTEGKFANCKSSQLYPWKHHLNIWVCNFSSNLLIRIWLFCSPSLRLPS